MRTINPGLKIILTRPGCIRCDQAKEFLAKSGISYLEIPITSNLKIFPQALDHKIAPIVLEYVGGLEELQGGSAENE